VYTNPKGFFDISKRPKSLSKREQEKIQQMQMFLADQNEKREYLKKHEPTQWEKLKDTAAELQQIILSHWSLEEIS
jgi:dsDNA-binding SOS-regulon protein